MCVWLWVCLLFRRECWIKGLRWVWSCDCHGLWWPCLLTDYPGEGEVACFSLYFLLLSLHPSFCQDSLSSHPSWSGWSFSLLWLPVLSHLNTQTCTETLISYYYPSRGVLFILTFASGFFDLELQAHTTDLSMQRWVTQFSTPIPSPQEPNEENQT